MNIHITPEDVELLERLIAEETQHMANKAEKIRLEHLRRRLQLARLQATQPSTVP